VAITTLKVKIVGGFFYTARGGFSMRVTQSASQYEEIELAAWLTPIAMPKEQKCGHYYTFCENDWITFFERGLCIS
jgi:hypothetical protein